MTVKTKKTEPALPLTFADVARKKMRERLTEYRAFVERAVAGEQLTEDDTVRVYDILTSLGLAPLTFERDVQGAKEYARQQAKWSDYQAQEPVLRQRGKQVAEEIKTLTEQLNGLKAEAHRIEVVSAHKAAGALQRVNELKTFHPHVLLPIDEAVEIRARALKLDAMTEDHAMAGRAS